MTDFHLHTTASDGMLSPSGLVAELRRRGVEWGAVTDHDTIAGWADAAAAAEGAGIVLLPGAELSVRCQGEHVHVLALGIDPEYRPLAEWFASYRVDRQERAEAMMHLLVEHGVPFDRGRIPEPAPDRVIARPHLAEAIVAAGGAEDMDDAFARYLGDGAPCFVAVPPRSSADAIRMVHAAGGLAVLAHPGEWTGHRTLLTMIAEGLDGIEVGHPSHDDRLRTYYESLVDRYGLVATAGSDFHGRYPVEFDRLGTFGLEEPRIDLLRERLRTARTRA